MVLLPILRAASSLAVVSVVAFVVLMVGPNPLEQLRESPEYTAADIERLTRQYGWDRPLHEQYLEWAGGLVRGDGGESFVSGRPAMRVIGERVPLTLTIAALAQLLAIGGAYLLGSWQARASPRAQAIGAAASFATVAVPGLVLALLLQLGAVLLVHRVGFAPVAVAGLPMDPSLLDYARHLALPVVVLSVGPIAVWNRMLRLQLLEEQGRGYAVVARAKGLRDDVVQRRHVLRNAVRPFVPILALDVAGLIGGALVVEKVFNLPGTGSLFLSSVAARDYVVVLDMVMLGTLVLVAANLLGDILLRRLDPRIAGGMA